MLYELESSPYTQKSSTVTSKLKVSNTSLENKNSNENNTNNVRVCKNVLNGVGFTSDKLYGPELPPAKAEKILNGNSTNLNGSSILDSPPTSSESDSDVDNNVILLPCKSNSADSEKENDISSTSVVIKQYPTTWNKNTSSVSSPNVSTTTSPLSEFSHKEGISSSPVKPQITKSLVPYDSDDTSSSDDANASTAECKDSRVSTKAAVGELKFRLLKSIISG